MALDPLTLLSATLSVLLAAAAAAAPCDEPVVVLVAVVALRCGGGIGWR